MKISKGRAQGYSDFYKSGTSSPGTGGSKIQQAREASPGMTFNFSLGGGFKNRDDKDDDDMTEARRRAIKRRMKKAK